MREKLIKIICQVKEDDSLKEKIEKSKDLLNEIDIDSLQLINIILKIEDELDVQIDFDEFDMDSLKSIDSLAKYINSKR
ncbi:acyl carrier protein [Clostridium acetobutylicum]|uniref:Possible D-alanyl carrier protein, acyl carrier protein family n=1 Tax=Clostridium acetobutylicum (strain ATCC 824 / DSM 792 / JCM 1419 / IAM 19013 / LMG 5710 / NBRC 13948 / NRRL B-527 / VKM B-1787 / 2291 / W) TaxID=272562 RepID=Q97TG2_CLOAB|nr:MULTISPECIES: acyl carrier protein [Clostridium]AAK76884.1 Possible D-alanyl carrier protein, acyl carrier protein family [Clostridium acetobutylicum ATCC 824]ADZ22921.1 putative D-alanyl carrier protein, acyl carrier protein family [Clostridium acetobutylicum EA 2018]AEI34880.1 D-alanyl carrier protein [Clostridium acetobutylicum DSM 1731]AWV82426.1 acyl carrier protein [Clostridium acetobutylicum]MBC2395730.1 acyl carrier protein [Clostridium acetobutylicum]